VNKRNPWIPFSIIFFDRIPSRECERHRFRLRSGRENSQKVLRAKSSLQILTNEVQLNKAFAKFKNSFKATILRVGRTLQRGKVNEETRLTGIKH